MSANIQIREPAWLREFKAFLMRGSVVELAVGLVVGAAFTIIVTSLVEDLINPFSGLAVGGVDFSNNLLVLSGERRAYLEATREGGAAVLAIGKFIIERAFIDLTSGCRRGGRAPTWAIWQVKIERALSTTLLSSS